MGTCCYIEKTLYTEEELYKSMEYDIIHIKAEEISSTKESFFN